MDPWPLASAMTGQNNNLNLKRALLSENNLKLY